MSKEFKIPELGEGVKSATVAQILVSEGDEVEEDQSVMELETEKASTDVPCDIAGTVEKIHVEEGDEIKVGETVLTLKESGESGPENSGKQQGKSETEDSDKASGEDEANAEEKEPDENPDEKKDKVGEQPERDEKEEAPKPDEGEQSEPDEEEPEPDEKAESEADQKEQAEPDDEDEEPGKNKESGPIPAAPSVRRLAREIGVDLSSVQGSGPHGRISTGDVKAHARLSAGGKTLSAKLPDFSEWGGIERKPMSKVRELTAQQMARAASIVPQATQFGEADVTEIDKLSEQYAREAKEAGGHLSLTVILIKTLAGAAKVFPQFNASVDMDHKEIIYKNYINIGIAMDTDRGLVVPVIRDADKKNVIELAVELNELTDKARSGKLTAEEMHGGCMTITNAGALGGDLFVPIVNWPEAAILGVAKTRPKPVFLNGTFEARQILPLSLSYDHRLIDGADGVRFMNWLTEALEDPVKLAWGS